MDSQETANNAAEATSARGPNVVKPNAPLSPGFQARPQGPPGSPRQPVNNGPIGAPRPIGQAPPQIRRLDSRASLGPAGSPQQFVQLRPYGPPRPPGSSFPQRPTQPGQNPPQGAAIVLNPRFVQPPPRGPGSQAGGPRPYPGNYQQLQRGNSGQRPRQPVFEPPSAQNGPLQSPRNTDTPPFSSSPRFGQEIGAQRQLQRNESPLNLSRQNSASNEEENKRSARPRIVIDRMADVESAGEKLQQMESPLQKKRSPEIRENGEKDDDDDVVMDEKKSPRTNGEAVSDHEGLVVGSAAPQTPKKYEDVVQNASRPGTATIGEKTDTKSSDEKRDEKGEEKSSEPSSRTASAKVEGRVADETANNSNSVSIDDRPLSSRVEDKVEEKVSSDVPTTNKVDSNIEDVPKEDSSKQGTPKKDAPKEATVENASREKASTELTEKSVEEQPSDTPNEKIEVMDKTTEDKSKSPAKSNDITQRDTKSPLPTTTVTEDKLEKPTTPRDSTPTPEPNVEQTQIDESSIQVKTPTKSADKSPSKSPLEPEQRQNEEKPKTPSKSPEITTSIPTEVDQTQEETETPSKTPDKSRSSTPASIDRPSNEEGLKVPPKSPNTRSNTPTATDNSEADTTEVSVGEKPSENSHHDEISESSNRDSSVHALESSEATDRAGSKSPATPSNQEKLSVPGSAVSPPSSPQESVKGFDNGQRRSLSSRSSPSRDSQSPISPKSPTGGAKLIDGERKKTSFAEDSINEKRNERNAGGKKTPEPRTKSPSKPSTPASKIQLPSTPAKSNEKSEKKSSKQEIKNGNATNESMQSNTVPTTNGVAESPTKKSPSKSKETDKRSTAGSPVKSPSKPAKSLPRTPETPSSTADQEKKKLPMNKIQVGSAPSPNLKTVRSKIGSLENASYKPGGGKVKIENRKLDFSKAQPKIAAKNEKYTPSGGDKKIAQVKLQWNAKPKVGSLENATYKPGGGDKKIETVKLDFKDKAKPKVGSKENAKHVPGGGSVKSSATPPKTPQDSNNDIQTQKIDIKAESKIGSLDNVKHKPGGGDKKIFNDKDYLRQTGSNVESLSGSGSQAETPGDENGPLTVERTKDESPQPPPSTPTKARLVTSPSSVVTPRAVRSSLAKSPDATGPRKPLTPTTDNPQTDGGNKKNSGETTESRTVTKEKSPRSPTTPRPPSSLRLKSPDKSSPGTPRKGSPKELRLPKLATSPVPPEPAPLPNTHSKITLPKLIEPSTQSTRVAH